MARITVIGGTGYAGRGIVEAAVERGHEVTSYSRHLPEDRLDGVEYRTGSFAEEDVAREAVDGSDVVVVAVPPRGEMVGRVGGAIAQLASIAQDSGARLGVVGGAASLRVAPDGPRILDGDVPAELKPEMLEMAQVLSDLRAADEALDWFYFSPAGGFGSFAPGETTGKYRLGGEVLVTDAQGNSNLSAGDLGIAILDEIEKPAHRRERFTAAY
ncbi:NAD-dependent epimerase [Tessaracoccus rhinocerotis]|uniref:NAD-dependent epimerase n=1 Tax=Tessaracoccus rhinocerotis TaxID=1689449 RepID=A0A553K0C7_9ACTN|nr:NAD(P)H-binding protein [Tessaracoccus rhinocerotis]TRY18160.1 NAD-dependent epimerase [Tessaracoccus rhinocerotis]